ncbi:MAG: GNAT family N-acetyltransferase [Pseudomonadota bacterium]
MSEVPGECLRLSASDLGLHREVLRLYASALDDTESYACHPPSDEYIASLLERSDFMELVMIVDGRVVGALSAYMLRKFEQERSEIYIYDLAVDEAHRRKGVATALIEALRPIAREANAHVIIVQAEKGDSPAEALYSTLGQMLDVSSFDIGVSA